MDSAKINDWLQIAATVGVLAGIFFVAQELRQNNELAKAQSVREIYMEWQEIFRFEYENDVKSLIYKSHEQSKPLTDSEIRMLSSYFDMLMGVINAQASMEIRFGLAYSVIDDAVAYADDYFSTPIGRAWFYENLAYVGYENEEIFAALKNAVDNIEVRSEVEYLKDLKSRL